MSQELEDPKGIVCTPRYKRFLTVVNTCTLLFILLVLGLQVYWLGGHFIKPIDGSSMQPYVNNYPNPIGDIAIVSKYQTVKRGDVVIIDMTGSKNTANDVNKKSLIKRVIAVGGDKLRIVVENGVVAVYVNDIKLNEPYIKDVYNQSIQKTEYFQNQTGWADWMDEYGNSTLPPLDSDGTIIIPSGYFFFMGDNRADSFDCRSMGPMPMSYIDGVVEEILDINNFWNKLITFLF